MAQKTSKSKAVAQKTLFAAFKILSEAGGEMNGSDVIDKIRETVEFSDWEKERYEKTGNIRWESILHFYTIDCAKAGFLRKNKGVWYLTEDGEKAMQLGPEKLLSKAQEEYKKWKSKQDQNKDKELEETDTQSQQALLDKYEEEALEGIKKHLNSKNPYDFQDMVAALLRAMGYYTPHVASRGKDGGIDIIAYGDPLGTKEPEIVANRGCTMSPNNL